jgi:hypothetical protein
MARFILRDAILSYPNLFTPRVASEGKPPTFSAAFIFTDPAALADYKKAALAVAQERFGDKLKGAKIRTLDTQHGPAQFLIAGEGKNRIAVRLPWQDDADVIEGKGYPQGSIFINARSQGRPGVVGVIPGPDGRPQPITNENAVYPGVIVNVSVDLYAYSKEGNNGVSAGLGNVQVVRDGDRLDRRVDARNEFDADTTVADLSDLTDEGEDLAGVGADDGDDLSDLIG